MLCRSEKSVDGKPADDGYRCAFRGAGIEYRDLGKVLARSYRILRDTIERGATSQSEEFDVSFTVAHITLLISLLAGALILVVPALLNYIVAIYLIVGA